MKSSTVTRLIDPDKVALLKFSESPRDHWTCQDAFMGTQILGGTGSGKTSGSGQAIARSFLRNGFGGLVLTAKQGDYDNWVEYCRSEEREPPLRVHIGGEIRFNILDYMHGLYKDGSSGGLTQNLVSLLVTALAPSGTGGGSSERYWDDALRQMLTHAIDLVALSRDANHRLTLQEVAAVIRHAPQGSADIRDPLWTRGSACWAFLVSALQRFQAMDRDQFPVAEWHDLTDTRDYWLHEFPNLADKTRSVIVSSFTSRVMALLRSPLRELLCSDQPQRVSLEDTFKGRVIVLDLPVKNLGEVGRTAQVILKTIWQRAAESSRRNLDAEGARPVFLWADEAQYFVTSEDMLFQQTARSKHAATVYLTQNLPNYYAALDTTGSTSVTESLLGNLSMKIFHANGDPSTNEWAERVFGQKRKKLRNPSTSPGAAYGSQTSRQETPVVRGSTLTSLRSGGHARTPNDALANKVEGIAFFPGRTWEHSKSTAIAFYCDQDTGAISTGSLPADDE